MIGDKFSLPRSLWGTILGGALACAGSAGAIAQVYVGTIAGDGTVGQADGTGAAAKFNYPYGLARDGSGNMYTVDRVSHTVRKITPAGVVTTYAGQPGAGGTINGPKASAKFNSPTAVTADAAGNVYVFDSSGINLRKISTVGIVTTLVPFSTWMSQGYMGGFSVLGMAADSGGNIYMGEWACMCIRKVTPAGTVSIYAGVYGSGGAIDGPASSAKFSFAQGVAVDGAGNVYVADTGNNRIRKITPTGMVSTLAGTGVAGHADGPGATAQFYAPWGIVVAPNGNIYVNDFSSNQSYIREITPAGVVSTLAGSSAGFADGAGASAQFSSLSGLTTQGGTLYATDFGNQRIRKIWKQKRIEAGSAAANKAEVLTRQSEN